MDAHRNTARCVPPFVACTCRCGRKPPRDAAQRRGVSTGLCGGRGCHELPQNRTPALVGAAPAPPRRREALIDGGSGAAPLARGGGARAPGGDRALRAAPRVERRGRGRRGECRASAAERARPLDADHVARRRPLERAARGRGPGREAPAEPAPRGRRRGRAPRPRGGLAPPPGGDAAPERRPSAAAAADAAAAARHVRSAPREAGATWRRRRIGRDVRRGRGALDVGDRRGRGALDVGDAPSTSGRAPAPRRGGAPPSAAATRQGPARAAGAATVRGAPQADPE